MILTFLQLVMYVTVNAVVTHCLRKSLKILGSAAKTIPLKPANFPFNTGLCDVSVVTGQTAFKPCRKSGLVVNIP